jgi:hypothetical protein
MGARNPRLRAEDREDLRLFAEHHLVGIERSKKGREITRVKHAVFGWIEPRTFYLLQHLHESRDLLREFVQGGYRLKQALAQISFSVATVSIPIGGALYATALVKGVVNIGSPDPRVRQLGVLYLLGLMLPFGEPLLILAALQEAVGIGNDLFGPSKPGEVPPGSAGLFGQVGFAIATGFVSLAQGVAGLFGSLGGIFAPKRDAAGNPIP